MIKQEERVSRLSVTRVDKKTNSVYLSEVITDNYKQNKGKFINGPTQELIKIGCEVESYI